MSEVLKNLKIEQEFLRLRRAKTGKYESIWWGPEILSNLKMEQY